MLIAYIQHHLMPHHASWMDARSVQLAYRIAGIHSFVETCPHAKCEGFVVRRAR